MKPFAVLTLVFAPVPAMACAVCFGADGGNAALGQAFNIAVTITLGVTMGLIASGIVWFRRMEARRMAQDALTIARLDRDRHDAAGWAGPSPSPAP